MKYYVIFVIKALIINWLLIKEVYVMGLFIDKVILQGIFVVYNFTFTMLSKDINLMLCQLFQDEGSPTIYYDVYAF